MKKLILAVALAVGCTGMAAHAQAMKMEEPKNDPTLSPPHQADVDLKGTKVHISYGAPSMRGRKIMGGLVPYTEWWRTGANEATTFEVTGGAVMLDNLHVPPGKYTLVTLPSAGQWQVVICKHTGQWGTERFANDDLGKTAMKKATLPAPQELMSITFEKTKGNETQLHIKWETTDVWVPVYSM